MSNRDEKGRFVKGNTGGFQKGHPRFGGRSRGTKNKRTSPVAEIIREMLISEVQGDDARAVRAMIGMLLRHAIGTVDADGKPLNIKISERHKAIEMLFNRLDGLPRQQLQLDLGAGEEDDEIAEPEEYVRRLEHELKDIKRFLITDNAGKGSGRDSSRGNREASKGKKPTGQKGKKPGRQRKNRST